MKQKVCTKCRVNKLFEDFDNHPYAKDKKNSVCKVCIKKIVQDKALRKRDDKKNNRKFNIGENWVAVKGLPDYEVSDWGNVFSYKRIRLLKPSLSQKKYLMVRLAKIDGSNYDVSLHRLVAIHFIPNPENKSQVNHLDGDKST